MPWQLQRVCLVTLWVCVCVCVCVLVIVSLQCWVYVYTAYIFGIVWLLELSTVKLLPMHEVWNIARCSIWFCDVDLNNSGACVWYWWPRLGTASPLYLVVHDLGCWLYQPVKANPIIQSSNSNIANAISNQRVRRSRKRSWNDCTRWHPDGYRIQVYASLPSLMFPQVHCDTHTLGSSLPSLSWPFANPGS